MSRTLGLLSLLLLISDPTKSFADFAPVSEKCASNAGCYVLSGEITNLDALAVHTMIQNLHARNTWGYPIVILNSRGGNIDAAMEIGRNLRKVKAIANIRNSDMCFSACVFVLAGATQRAVSGEVGIHRPYSPRTGSVSTEDAQREYTRLSRISKTYLSEMNLPEDLYEAMVRTPPEELKILNEYELEKFGLNTEDPVFQDVGDSSEAKKYGLTKQEYLHRKALSNQICDSALQQTGDGNIWFRCHERVLRTGE